MDPAMLTSHHPWSMAVGAVITLAGCHLVFPFNVPEPAVDAGGVDAALTDADLTDLPRDQAFEGLTDGRGEQQDAPADYEVPEDTLTPKEATPTPDLWPSPDSGSQPTVLWVATSSGAQSHVVRALDVALDSSGNSYVTGSVVGTALLDKDQLLSKGNEDVFVASYDLNGKLRWSKTFGGTGSDKGHRLAVDSGKAVYVCGVARGPVMFDGKQHLGASTIGDPFVVRYTTTGKPDWLVLLKSGSGTCEDVAIVTSGSSKGGVHVTGAFTGNLTFGGPPLASAGLSDGFVGTLPDSGYPSWSARFGGLDDVRGKAVALDTSGSIVVAGEYEGILATVPMLPKSVGPSDLFAIKNLLTSPAKVFAMGGLGADKLNAITFSSQGLLFAVGSIHGSVKLGGMNWGQLNRRNGYLLKQGGTTASWSRATSVANLTDIAELSDVAAEGSSVYVTGTHSGSVALSGDNHGTKGGQDVLLGRYDAKGQRIWTRSYGGKGNDLGRGVAVNSSGLFMTGSFQGSVMFEWKSVTSKTGHTDMYLVRFKPQP